MPDSIRNIDQQFNYNNIYFRMLNISLAKTLNKRLRWINYFRDEKKCVIVPIYLKYAGSERFLLDSYIDDITDKRVELNTDQIPRGIITPTSFNSISEEFSNPNIYMPKNTKIHNKYTKVITKVFAIPINVSYEVEIRIDNEIDTYKCSEKILDLFFNYRFFNMNYFGIKIDNILELPDDKNIELPTEISMDSDNVKSITFSLNVRSYYPSWKVDTDRVECENEEFENIKRVYWKSYVSDMDKLDDDLPIDPNLKRMEDFDKKGDFAKNNPTYSKFNVISTGITWG
jgi:hypothetical protein